MFQKLAKGHSRDFHLINLWCYQTNKLSKDCTDINILKMANTLSVMTNVLRNVVSKQRIRYKEKGFNLDLAYISDNIIAMGYPADNIESFYRNRIEDVYKFLEENHHDHYKIYNLCLERSYDISKFHGRVAVYAFEDHNPPTIELIQKFCYDVDCWLKKDALNVAAIHCKAGKGRTGTMICCYLLYSGLQGTAEDALACYDEKRTKDRKGVTIPSQRRYVQYFSKLIQSGLPYEKRTLQFCEIRFVDAGLLQNQGTVYCSISVLHDTSTVKVETLQTHIIDCRKSLILDINNPSLSVTGDIKVELKTSKKKIFHFWFNTCFVCDSADIEDHGEYRKLVYTLYKSEIDDAHKDKEHKIFSEDFKVQMVFLRINAKNKNTEIDILQPCGKKIHTEAAAVQDLGSSHYKSMLLQHNSSGSDLNYMCDQKSPSSASARSTDVNKASGTCEEVLVNAGFTEIVPSSYTTSDVATEARQKNERQSIRTGSSAIPTCYYPMQVIQSPQATKDATTTQNYAMLQIHNQLCSEQIFIKQQTPALAPNLRRSSSKMHGVGGNLMKNSISRHANIINCNSNESSSSISSRSSSSAAGDNEEDWESGESTYL